MTQPCVYYSTVVCFLCRQTCCYYGGSLSPTARFVLVMGLVSENVLYHWNILHQRMSYIRECLASENVLYHKDTICPRMSCITRVLYVRECLVSQGYHMSENVLYHKIPYVRECHMNENTTTWWNISSDPSRSPPGPASRRISSMSTFNHSTSMDSKLCLTAHLMKGREDLLQQKPLLPEKHLPYPQPMSLPGVLKMTGRDNRNCQLIEIDADIMYK